MLTKKNSKKGKALVTKSIIGGCQGPGVGKRGLIAKKCEGPFWGHENILYHDHSDGNKNTSHFSKLINYILERVFFFIKVDSFS